MLQLIITLLTVCYTTIQNPYEGTWECYTIKSRDKDREVSLDDYPAFASKIIFNSDMTYTKVTGEETTKGKYEFTPNRLYFYEPNEQGEMEQAWMLRWPKKTNDPSPITPEVDFNYPELFTIKDEKAGEKFVELDVYYKKTK